MSKKFYKTTEAIEAWDNYFGSVNKMRKECEELSDAFGGSNALISYSITGHSFYGIEFKGSLPENSELWTKPRKQTEFTARPRASIKDKDLKPTLKELAAKYKDLMPEVTSVRFDDIYTALGTNWGDVMFSGMQWFKHNGFIYFSTGASSTGEEIMGSEFESAMAKYKSEQKDSLS